MLQVMRVFRLQFPCVQFGTDEPYEKVVFVTKNDGPDTRSFDTEREMLEAFQKYIHEKDM